MVTGKIVQNPEWQKRIGIALYAAIVAFIAYSSIFAYRKPFSIATFNNIQFWGISYQTLLIISQVIGYMLSKFAGIKLIAELQSKKRFAYGLVITGLAWLCLLFFAIVPAPYGIVFMFINGFLLGFMWGIVFSYIEGRTATDFIGASLAVSFIFAGGFSRSVGKWLMTNYGVTEYWMPFMTGLVFAAPLCIFFILLNKLPPPDVIDREQRTVRIPMNKPARKSFVKKFAPGIILVTVTYLFITIMRDVRDNYMGNIWQELGYGNQAGIFARSEVRISIIILVVMAMLVFIRNNRKAFMLVHIIIAAGILLAGVSSFLFMQQSMNGALWMQLTGLGLYMAYIPFNCIFFERMIATFKVAGNVGFLIYIADAFGYLGSISVMLSKELMFFATNWSTFYAKGVFLLAILATTGTLSSYFYFAKKYRLTKFPLYN